MPACQARLFSEKSPCRRLLGRLSHQGLCGCEEESPSLPAELPAVSCRARYYWQAVLGVELAIFHFPSLAQRCCQSARIHFLNSEHRDSQDSPPPPKKKAAVARQGIYLTFNYLVLFMGANGRLFSVLFLKWQKGCVLEFRTLALKLPEPLRWLWLWWLFSSGWLSCHLPTQRFFCSIPLSALLHKL